jgi:hypothetical protein
MTSITDFYGGRRLEVTDAGVEIPKQVINTVAAAKSIYFKLRNNHIKRIMLYAEINGMIAGNAPYDVNKLREANLTHISNFNTLEPRSLYERAGLAYWNLLFTSEKIINFTFRYPGVPEASHYAEIVGRHWDRVVRTMWRSFDTNVAVLCGQLVKFGISPIIWPDENEMHWRVVELSKFYVADQSASDLDLLSIACVETEVAIVYLMEVFNEYRNRRNETDWNIDQLEKFLIWIANNVNKDPLAVYDQTELERKLSAGDISYDRMYNETVRLVSLYYKENDGTITHFMFHRDWDDGGEFLYKNKSQYRSFDDCLLIFTQSPGEQFIHGNRGIGHKVFSICQAKMMLDNSLVDMARWSSTPILKSPAMTVKDSEQVRFYPGVPTYIGSSEFVQNNLGANLQGVIATSQYFSNLLQQNAAFSGDDPGVQDRSLGSLSPSQTRLQAFKEFGVLRNQVNHFYSTFDVLLRQMVIRMVNATSMEKTYDIFQEWKERCVQDGVPEELFKPRKKGMLPQYWEVHATRSAGAGSQVAEIIALQELQPLVGSFGRREQEAYKRDYIKATVGADRVAAYTQDSQDVDEVGGGASLAGLENTVMQDGKSPLFSPANDHRSHVAIHLALANQIIQGITEQQIDVVQADRVFTVLIPHLQEHMQALSQNIFAQAFVQQIQKTVGGVIQYAQVNRRNAVRALEAKRKQEMEDVENTRRVMTEQEREDYKVQKDEARKDFKLMAQEKRVNEANRKRAETLQQKTDATVQAIREKTRAQVAAINKKENPSIERTNASEELSNMTNGSTPTPYDFEPQ